MAILDLSLQMKIGLPCLVLGIILFCVSFGVTSWGSGSYNDYDFDMGLWKMCASNSHTTICHAWTSSAAKDTNLQKSWLHKTQALECIALLLVVGAFGAVIVFLITKMKLAVLAAIGLCILSAAFMIIACAVYASDFNSDDVYSAVDAHLNWGFGFNIVAAIFMAAAAVGLILHALLATTTGNSPT